MQFVFTSWLIEMCHLTANPTANQIVNAHSLWYSIRKPNGEQIKCPEGCLVIWNGLLCSGQTKPNVKCGGELRVQIWSNKCIRCRLHADYNNIVQTPVMLVTTLFSKHIYQEKKYNFKLLWKMSYSKSKSFAPKSIRSFIIRWPLFRRGVGERGGRKINLKELTPFSGLTFNQEPE